MRDNDIVARLGGDAFVVVLADLVDTQDATGVASKIIDSLSQPIALGIHALRASVSVGICFYPQDGQDRGALMQSADIAMYHAKNAGKGVFHFFDAAMMTAAAKRTESERALREAISLQQFVLHYQPQLDAASQRATGVEALIRWQKPSGELVPPAELIPLAEELGLINEMGDWALRTACHALAHWRQHGLVDLTMAVNLSAIQLRNPSLPQHIADALRDSGLPGQALTLDYLKLDRVFVQDLETDSNDAAICTATIGLAHNLGFAVIAEGVETQAQRDFLANLGCDAFQGYYFSRALPEAAAFDWLVSQARKLLESQALLTTSTDSRNY